MKRMAIGALLAAAFLLGFGRPARAADTPVDPPALYTQIVSNYLAAQWDTLEEDLARAQKVTVYTKDQQADLAYIRQAFAECRPAWWGQVKQGQKVQFKATLWQKTFAVTYDPTLQGSMQYKSPPPTLLVNWPAADMDSLEKAEHGFTKGDLLCGGIWATLENAETIALIGFDTLGKATPAQKSLLDQFLAFRGNLAGIYYGTPRARSWCIFLSLDAYGAKYLAEPGFIVRKPTGAMYLAEIAANPSRYPTLKLPKSVPADTAESRLASLLMPQFEKKFTLAEDKALREAAKQFFTTTGTAGNTGRITLLNKMPMMMNPEEDAPLAVKRNAWLSEAIAHPGAAPATNPTSQPASGPAMRIVK